MSKIIRIDDDVLKKLEKNARPYETPNKTIRRLLKIDHERQKISKT